MAKITKNFTTDEMKCPCCGECEMDEKFMANLQRIREQCGFGFRINSAYRCAEYKLKCLAIPGVSMQQGKLLMLA